MGFAPAPSSLRILLRKSLIATFNAIAKRRFGSRPLPRLPLAIGTTHGAMAVRQMVAAKMAALRTESPEAVTAGLITATTTKTLGGVSPAVFVEETALRGISQQWNPRIAIEVAHSLASELKETLSCRFARLDGGVSAFVTVSALSEDQ